MSARRAGLGYIGMKFVRRHPLAMTVLLLIAAAGTFATWRVVQEAQRAERTKQFLKELIAQISPLSKERGSQYLATDFLADAADRIDGSLTEAPLDQADLAMSIAMSLTSFGQPERAVPIIERAVSRMRGLFPSGGYQLADALTVQASIYKNLGRFEEAERIADEALGMLDLDDETDLDLAITVRTLLGTLAARRGDEQAAMQLRQSTLRDRVRLFGSDHIDVATDWYNLAGTYLRGGDYVTAMYCFEEALRILAIHVEPDHLRISLTKSGMATAARLLGDLDRAQRLSDEALQSMRRSLARGSGQLVLALHRRGVILYHAGRPQDATAVLQEAADNAVAANDADTQGFALYYLGRISYRNGDWEAARLHLLRAKELMHLPLGPTQDSLLMEIYLALAAPQVQPLSDPVVTEHLAELRQRGKPARYALSEALREVAARCACAQAAQLREEADSILAAIRSEPVSSSVPGRG